MSSEIKNFRRRSSPDYSNYKPKRTPNRYRESARARGYDNDWQKLSLKYRKAVKGRCEECAREGVLHLCDVVDHMVPIVDHPELRLEWSNLDALCHKHHNGVKRRIENFARKTGALRMLPQWMKFPETRPIHFQIKSVGKPLEVAGGLGIINSIQVVDDEEVATPKLISPNIMGEEIFFGPGILVHAINNTDVAIILSSGDNDILELQDGESLSTKLKLSDGLIIRSSEPAVGKVSLAYVES